MDDELTWDVLAVFADWDARDARQAAAEPLTQKCLIHMPPDVDHCRGCAADRKAAESA